MTQAQENFLIALRASRNGEQVEPARFGSTLPEVLAIAIQQHLLPVILETVPEAHAPSLKDSTLAAYRQLAVQQVTRQAERTLDFYALYRYLRKEGLHPVVVKGELCSRLYPWPYHRISADHDLYIEKTEFPSCHRALLAYGLRTETPEEKLNSTDEVTYRDDNRRYYIELHRALFDTGPDAPDDLNQFFPDVFGRLTEVDGMLSMQPHEHLLFLLLHAFKHFIHSGVGIRQTCDMALWVQAYADQIDWTRLKESCRLVHAERFAAAQFRIAQQYLGCSLPLPDCWQIGSVEAEPMLLDMFAGGVFGVSSLSRQYSSTGTMTAIRRNRAQKKPCILRSIFPTRTHMAKNYPYVQKHPLLLPAAWTSRIFRCIREIRQDGSGNASESLRLTNQRVELMRYYGVIE